MMNMMNDDNDGDNGDDDGDDIGVYVDGSNHDIRR